MTATRTPASRALRGTLPHFSLLTVFASRVASLLVGLSLLGSPAAGADSTAAAFLKLPVDARGVSVGAAMAALSQGVGAMAYNPAGLSVAPARELSLMYAPHLQGTNLGYMAYAHPTRLGSFGLSHLMLRSGGMDGRDEQGRATESFAAEDRAMGVSFSRPVLSSPLHPAGRLALGANFKYITSRIGSYGAATYAVDLGVQMPRSIGRWPARFGLSLRNLGPGLRFQERAEPLPVNLSFGLALQPIAPLVVAAGGTRYLKGDKNEFTIGTEVTPYAGLFLRGNYGLVRTQGAAANSMPFLSWGLGYRFSRYQFDYAFMPLGDLGSTQRLNLTVRFASPALQPPALAKVPSGPDAARREKLPSDMVRAGWEAVTGGRLAQAALFFQRSLDAEPGNDRLYRMLLRLREATRLFHTVDGGASWAPLARRGVAAYVDGRDLRDAVVLLRQAYDLEPSNDSLLGLLNQVERAAGAREVTRRRGEAPGEGFVAGRLQAARQAIYNGRHEDAALKAREALQVSPDDAAAWQLLGSAYYLMGAGPQARKAWRKALELDPRNAVVADFLKKVE